MPKKPSPEKKSERKSIIRRVVSKAKKSAEMVLKTDRTLPKPVELEPHTIESPVLRALKKEKKRLLEELSHQDMEAQDHPTTGNHMADDASEVEAQTKALALRHHLEVMIEEIDHAIARAEKGTYGICEKCKKPISEERLKVMPSATLCINCAKSQVRPVLKASI